MRIGMRLGLGLAAAVLVAGTASAQQRQQQALIANKSVQEELKLDEEQVKKALDVEKAVAEKRRAKMGKLSDEERQGEKGRELRRKFNDELTSELGKFLKADQKTRYKQIEFQQAVRQALGGGRMGGGGGERRPFYENRVLAETIKFTDEQKDKLKELNENHGKRLEEARKEAGEDRAKAREAGAKVAKETIEKLEKMLNAEQKKKWQEAYGKPFTIRVQRPISL